MNSRHGCRMRHCKIFRREIVTTRVVMLSAIGLLLSGCPIIGATKFTVGGTVTGLNGTGLVLQINGGDALSFTANGTFVFGDRLANNAAYAVTIETQPSNPAQACT